MIPHSQVSDSAVLREYSSLGSFSIKPFNIERNVQSSLPNFGDVTADYLTSQWIGMHHFQDFFSQWGGGGGVEGTPWLPYIT